MSLLSPNLQAFLAVKAHHTVASAAQVLRLTQAAVTIRIQNLERDLNTNLFLRSRRGMQLTPSGEALARYCQRAQELEAETLPDLGVQPLALSPIRWVLQGPSSPMRRRVVPLAAGYLQRHPNVSLELRVTDLESGIDRLKEGSTDLLIAERSLVGKAFDSKLLKPERYFLVATSAWKHRTLSEILASERIIDFDPTDKMTHSFLKKYDLLSQARPERHFVNITEYIAELVQAGLGYTVLSEELVGEALKVGQLINICPHKFFDYEVALAWYPRKHMTASFRDLIKLIR